MEATPQNGSTPAASSGFEYGSGPFGDIFGDTARMRVIQFLASHSEPHHQVEISQATGSSQPMVSRAIKPMREHGLIEDHSQGIRLNDSDRAQALVSFIDEFYIEEFSEDEE